MSRTAINRISMRCSKSPYRKKWKPKFVVRNAMQKILEFCCWQWERRAWQGLSEDMLGGVIATGCSMQCVCWCLSKLKTTDELLANNTALSPMCLDLASSTLQPSMNNWLPSHLWNSNQPDDREMAQGMEVSERGLELECRTQLWSWALRSVLQSLKQEHLSLVYNIEAQVWAPWWIYKV